MSLLCLLEALQHLLLKWLAELALEVSSLTSRQTLLNACVARLRRGLGLVTNLFLTPVYRPCGVFSAGYSPQWITVICSDDATHEFLAPVAVRVLPHRQDTFARMLRWSQCLRSFDCLPWDPSMGAETQNTEPTWSKIGEAWLEGGAEGGGV